MSQVIKVNHVTKDGTKHIYVFLGGKDVERGDMGPNGAAIFSAHEWANIQKEQIKVSAIKAYIHGDDTVGAVRGKLVKYLKLGTSARELYLFGIKNAPLDPHSVYSQLTQQNTLPLDHERLCLFLLNLVGETCDDRGHHSCPPPKGDGATYDYEDIANLAGIDWGKQAYTVPIGQRVVIRKKYPFVANPFNCPALDPLLKKRTERLVSTQNGSLLFEHGPLCGNNIFLCMAEDVLTYAAAAPQLDPRAMLGLYFPALVARGVATVSDLERERQALYAEDAEQYGKGFVRYNEGVNLLYEMYDARKTELPYTAGMLGVTAAEFTLHPAYVGRFPLDILFKVVNATAIMPMVKYNPGPRRENIYRFFTGEEKGADGRKIPYLYTAYGNR